ncbi:MAG: esterase family protein [Phycisphaerae bacterium]|nr:esterase family protein [Phycisphaerae bacterium]
MPHLLPRTLGLACLIAPLACPAPTAQAQWTTPPVTAPRLEYRTFQSAAAGTTVSFHVFTPPQYDAQPDRCFPVLYWLHGSGSATAGIAPMTNWFASAMADGRLRPVIVVFPNGMPFGMYCDAANGSRPLETVIVGELVPHVDATMRTIASREGRIVEGFSMGGYGAGRFGLKYSDRFRAASLLGAGPVQTDFMNAPWGTGVPPARRAEIFQEVWNSDPAIFYASSPWWLGEAHRPEIISNGLRVRFAVGESDAMLAPNADLHARLLSLNLPHDWRTYPGVGHDTLALLHAMGEANWDFYREVLPPDGDWNADGVIDFNDLLTFLNDFNAATPRADVNRDGVVDFSDFLDFLNVFNARC